MAKLTVTVVVVLLTTFLAAAAAAGGTVVVTDAGATATIPAASGLQLQATRRSRFLLANTVVHSSLPSYAACSNKLCKHDRSTCCGGRCVDLISDKDNCGVCGNRCNKKCTNGFCDYAL